MIKRKRERERESQIIQTIIYKVGFITKHSSHSESKQRCLNSSYLLLKIHIILPVLIARHAAVTCGHNYQILLLEPTALPIIINGTIFGANHEILQQ